MNEFSCGVDTQSSREQSNLWQISVQTENNIGANIDE